MMRIWIAVLTTALLTFGGVGGTARLALARGRASEPAQAPTQSASGSAPNKTAANTADLDADIRNYDYEQLANALDGMPQSAERDYFAGVLANRTGDVDKSIQLLNKVLPRLESTDPRRAAVGLASLADDYVKNDRYNEAIPTYERLLQKFAPQLDAIEKQTTEDDYHTVLLLRNAPPQTISFDGEIDLPTHRDTVLGVIESNLTVNGVEQPWIVDTGANFSTVSARFAARLGVRISKGSAQTQGVTGAENKLHVALLPELKLGGAVVRNVVLLVLDDQSMDLQLGKTERYQINAVLGYPVLQALKRVTFTKDGHLQAGPDSPSPGDGARLYMDKLTPLLECETENRLVLFAFDTGAEQSMLSERYLRDFSEAFKGLAKEPFAMGGAGGVTTGMAYHLPEVELGVGQARAVLHKVPVMPATGTDLDRTYGNLGRDLVDQYQSFTIDFENMRFFLGERAEGISK
jgi:hypothetical protein